MKRSEYEQRLRALEETFEAEIATVRAAQQIRRRAFEALWRSGSNGGPVRNVVVVGAGEAGEALVRHMVIHRTGYRPVAFVDERFTTSAAEDALWDAGLSHKKRKERRDRVAAQLILQAYLDAGCPPG